MLDPGLLSFIRGSLPAAPARLLEVGAGDGELAWTLAADGYDLLAIDPASTTPDVHQLALHEVSEPAGSFDAAIAVLSMHHVEPLRESCHRLARLIRSGGVLVLDEIDFALFDERAAGWWLEHHDSPHEHDASAQEMVAELRHHCHLLSTIQETLQEWFELTPPDRGPYLYRWELGPGLREAETALIAEGRLPATGARLLGIRR
jgi:SAM-dependent methyltransferase